MTRQQLLAYLAEHQPATNLQIAEHFGVTRQRARDSLGRCKWHGLVRIVGRVQSPRAVGGFGVSDLWALAGYVPAPAARAAPDGIVPRAIRNRCALAMAWARPVDAQGAA